MEVIYAIVKRNNENYYIECKPTDLVIKIKNQLIKNFYPLEAKEMRLYLEKHTNDNNKYWLVNSFKFTLSHLTKASAGQRYNPSIRYNEFLHHLVYKVKR